MELSRSNNLVLNCNIFLTRGTAQQHAKDPFYLRRGNFSLVIDKPELRFHDGVTPGGVAIPIDPALHQTIVQTYSELLSKPTLTTLQSVKPSLWEKIKSFF